MCCENITAHVGVILPDKLPPTPTSFLSPPGLLLSLSSPHYPLTTFIPQSSEDTLVIYEGCCVSPGVQILLESL